MNDPHSDRLNLFSGMLASGMNYEQLWLRYVGVGGHAGPLELEGYVLGLLAPDRYQHDMIAQAINESFIERGENHPVGYWDIPDT